MFFFFFFGLMASNGVFDEHISWFLKTFLSVTKFVERLRLSNNRYPHRKISIGLPRKNNWKRSACGRQARFDGVHHGQVHPRNNLRANLQSNKCFPLSTPALSTHLLICQRLLQDRVPLRAVWLAYRIRLGIRNLQEPKQMIGGVACAR